MVKVQDAEILAPLSARLNATVLKPAEAERQRIETCRSREASA